MTEQDAHIITDVDRDSLFILPLAFVPFKTPAIHGARLIKNVRLESVVEIYKGKRIGSGQVPIETIGKAFGWSESSSHPDLVLLRQLAELPSYDIYSLRILFRRHNVPVTDYTELKLSESKKEELTEYMRSFTHPLIVQTYGEGNMDFQDYRDIITLFRKPSIERAREKLKIMALKLEIDLSEVPLFLEDYSDVFLSLSYFRQCLDQIKSSVVDFMESMQDLKKKRQFRDDKTLQDAVDRIATTLQRLMDAVATRFEEFDAQTKNMWEKITAKRFREVETLIKGHHTVIGGSLCAVTVKMNAWTALFPDRNAGGPIERASFIVSEMNQGIKKIHEIEKSTANL